MTLFFLWTQCSYNRMLIGSYMCPTQRCKSNDTEWQQNYHQHQELCGLFVTAELLVYLTVTNCCFTLATGSLNFYGKISNNWAIANRSRVTVHTMRWGHKYYTVTLKARLRVTQGHWKRNHWIDHTWLTISRVIWHWILSWPWNVG